MIKWRVGVPCLHCNSVGNDEQEGSRSGGGFESLSVSSDLHANSWLLSLKATPLTWSTIANVSVYILSKLLCYLNNILVIILNVVFLLTKGVVMICIHLFSLKQVLGDW